MGHILYEDGDLRFGLWGADRHIEARQNEAKTSGLVFLVQPRDAVLLAAPNMFDMVQLIITRQSRFYCKGEGSIKSIIIYQSSFAS